MKKFVGFGDSWMWGDELIDPSLADIENAHPVLVENTAYREKHCFLGQLSDYYGATFENFGWPGASLQSTIWCYLWWLEHGTNHADAEVIVTLTESSRTSWYNPRHQVYANDPPWNRFVHSSWVHSGGDHGEWGELTKLYTTLSDCLSLSRLNYRQTVTFFQGQQHRHPVHLILVSEPPCQIQAPELLSSESISTWLRRQARTSGKNLFKSGGHPNEDGHRLIRDLLIKRIDNAILA